MNMLMCFVKLLAKLDETITLPPGFSAEMRLHKNFNIEERMKNSINAHANRIKLIRLIILIACFNFYPDLSYSQPLTVSGKVSTNGNPLPGVTIILKGTAQGTTTDTDGQYSIAVNSPTAILVFSFIGYRSQELSLNNQTTLDVVMEEDVTNLTEVVVTALGVQKEVKSLGYAVQKVEGNTIQKAREPNIFNSLTGKVAGLEIRNQQICSRILESGSGVQHH